MTGAIQLIRLLSIVLALVALAPATATAAADMRKVLRISMNDITSLDPQQGTDLYSTRVTTSKRAGSPGRSTTRQFGSQP